MGNDQSPSAILIRARQLPRWFLLAIVLFAALPGQLRAANVTVDAGNPLSTVGDAAFGLHTSVYDNQNGNPNLPSMLMKGGVTTLRYPGGGYADIFHWSVSRPTLSSGGYGMTPWWGESGNYGYMGPSTDFGSFISLLTNSQCEGLMTVDFGSGQQWNAGHTELIVPTTNASPQEAAAWVAYANANTNIYGTANDVMIGTDALGNNWQTAGYWAMMRAASPLGVDDGYNFLRIKRKAPVGIKYWEIGNETFGSGYYNDGNGYSVNYAVGYPYTTNSRLGNSLLSPTAYGQGVKLFSLLMKAVDPTIKVGAVVSTPPGDYASDSFHGQHWTPLVLAQCATNVDFVIAHWYPFSATLDGSNLLGQVSTTIPFMINGATAGNDSGTQSGLRDWINNARPDGTNVQIFITEFGYNGSVSNGINGKAILGPVNALYAADAYSTWLRYGVANVDYLEMGTTSFLNGNGSSLTVGEVFFALQMVRHLANVGDTVVNATSDTGNLRTQAVLQQNGKLAILLINENPNSSQTVNVTVTNVDLSPSGTQYQFGVANFSGTNEIPVSGPSTNNTSSLGNTFSVTVPAYSMMVVAMPTNTAPTLAPIASQTVNVGQTVAFTALATDANQPPPALTFGLLSAPSNATVNAASGAFSWRPLVSQANTTNPITLQVTAGGTFSLSATQNFTVMVNPLVPPSVAPMELNDGHFVLQISGQSGPDYAVLDSTNLVNWSILLETNSPAMPFEWVDTNAASSPHFYRVLTGPPLP